MTTQRIERKVSEKANKFKQKEGRRIDKENRTRIELE